MRYTRDSMNKVLNFKMAAILLLTKEAVTLGKDLPITKLKKYQD